MTEKILNDAKKVLSDDQYCQLYLHYYNDFQKKWFASFSEYYKSLGMLKAMSAGVSSGLGEEQEIDFRSLSDSSSVVADMSNPGYPKSFYECIRLTIINFH